MITFDVDAFRKIYFYCMRMSILLICIYAVHYICWYACVHVCMYTNIYIIYDVCVCVCIMYCMYVWCLWRLEKSTRSPGTEVIEGYKPPSSAENQT